MKAINLAQSPLIFQAIPSRWHKSIPLYNLEGCQALLKCCDEIGVGVLGIEGFLVSGESIFPQSDFIADFSSLSKDVDFKTKSIQASLQFLRLAVDSPGILFEFTLLK